MTRKDITFRPIKPKDMPFLEALYGSTRELELSVVDWDVTQKKDFIKMQFDIQHKYYQQVYSEDSFDIIQHKNVAVGRLYLGKWKTQIRIIDIAIIPEYRNKGIGTLLIKELMAEAAKDSKALSIHVEQNNPAMTLYKRLGFSTIEDKGVYHLMEWKPA